MIFTVETESPAAAALLRNLEDLAIIRLSGPDGTMRTTASCGALSPKEEAAGESCPLCAKYTDPETGELHLNAETIAAIEEGRAMMRGEIPAKWYNSAEEMWADLDADDGDG